MLNLTEVPVKLNDSGDNFTKIRNKRTKVKAVEHHKQEMIKINIQYRNKETTGKVTS